MSVLSSAYFHNEEAAFTHLESIVWANGVTCPHCGSVSGKHYDLRKTRVGLRKCSDCRKQFTVKVGTVFESAHIPLNKMLQAVYLMTASKKGISAHQLHRVLEITYKSAWFLAHRIREAMRTGGLAPFGGNGGFVEVDETFIGTEPGKTKKPGMHHKMKVLTLVDRDSGQARSMVIDDLKVSTIAPILNENIAKEATLMTDEAPRYIPMGKQFAGHQSVNHAKDEYVRKGAPQITTNTVEAYFSVFKRGMKGTYQHCAKKHLHRYMAEFDFRYNNRSALGVEDVQRSVIALAGIGGKRLTYQGPSFT
jgi:transposase-like protein